MKHPHLPAETSVAALVAAAAGIIALAFVLVIGHGMADAAPLSGAGIVAIDADPAGNTATSIGGIDGCVSIPVGGNAVIDIVVDSIPSSGDATGIYGFGGNVTYTSGAGEGGLEVLSAADVATTSMIAATGIFTPTSFTEVTPDVDGDFLVAEADVTTDYETGAGRLFEFTVMSTGTAGLATLTLTDTGGGDFQPPFDVYASDTSAYSGTNIRNATVAVGMDCPAATPTPAGTQRKFGDITCDGNVNLGDAIGIDRNLVGLVVTQTPPCPAVGATVTIDGTSRKWADLTCDGNVALGDAIGIARNLVDLAVTQTPPCPALGDMVAVVG